jgi:hypothetical protein
MGVRRSETALPAGPSPPDPKRRLPPPKVRAAIELLVSGKVKTITAAAQHATVQLSRERLSRALSEPHIAEYLRTRAARVVGIASGRAAARLVELIDSGSEHVSFDASKHVLAIAGIKPASDPQVSINLEAPRAGYVILLNEPREPPKDIEGEAKSVD